MRSERIYPDEPDAETEYQPSSSPYTLTESPELSTFTIALSVLGLERRLIASVIFAVPEEWPEAPHRFPITVTNIPLDRGAFGEKVVAVVPLNSEFSTA